MNCEKKNLILYAVTDRRWSCEGSLAHQVEEALLGGVTMVQLREKTLGKEEFLEEAGEIKALCDRYHVPLIINDDVGIALAVDAAGVHLGQGDTDIALARQILGPDKIIGASARTVERACEAERQGADYLGSGAAFTTGTKNDAEHISRETLSDVCRAVSIPVVAIGGITADNIAQLAGCGIAGVAVVSAIFSQENIEAAARQLYNLSLKIL